MNTPKTKVPKTINSLVGLGGRLANNAILAATAQFNPLWAACVSYFQGVESSRRMDLVAEQLREVASRLNNIESKLLDRGFYESETGQAIVGRVLISMLRDSRAEKLIAFRHLLVNISLKSKVSVDLREQFVVILDDLTPLHLSILHLVRGALKTHPDKQLDGRFYDKPQFVNYLVKDNGISRELLYSVISKLESIFLLNQSFSSTFGGGTTMNAITELGESFLDFSETDLTPDSPWLLFN